MSTCDFAYIQKELEKFGLSAKQAQIYVLLVAHKELRIQEIVKLANMPRSSVYESLKKLFELGIAEEVILDNYKIIRPYSISAIKNGLNEKILNLKKLRNDLDQLETTISSAGSSKSLTSTQLRYYRDRSGARQLYWNSLKANSTVYVYSDFARWRYVGEAYYRDFVAESRTRNIKEKVLINPSKEMLSTLKQNNYPNAPLARTLLEDIRLVDNKQLKINGDALIYDNIYAQVYLENIGIRGFEIESEQFAATQKSIFETMWNLAIPVSQFIK